MGFEDTLGYLAFGNPVSRALISTTSSLVNTAVRPLKKLTSMDGVAAAVLPPPQLPLWELAGRNYTFVRIAGLSGAVAVIMGAYGKSLLGNITDAKDQMQRKGSEAKAIFETANRYHFLHSFVLLAMPLARRPAVTGSLMVIGTILFSGTMYYRAWTGNRRFVHVATSGGFCLVAAWFSLVF